VGVIKKGGDLLPDPTKVKQPGFACIPLLGHYTINSGGTITMRGPATPPNPEDAESYLNLQVGFAIGHMVPDPFWHLFDAIGQSYHPEDARDAMLSYGLIHHITAANAQVSRVDRHMLSTFLITLATFQRLIQLHVGQNSMCTGCR
jgi:hypothetical protein